MQQQPLNLIHVVRRYGPVGGMERYVWELTRELSAMGHQVAVVCECCHAARPDGIDVHELGAVAQRPGWLAHLRFSRHVADWLQANPHPDSIIHSHERIGIHQVTTFHGPPFATVLDQPLWKRLSPRIRARLWLERRELEQASVIVPNSGHVWRQLAHYYPALQHKFSTPIVPGVASGRQRNWRSVPENGGILLFVGKEWKRKGLPLAIAIAARLRRQRPALELWVAGPDADEIRHLFRDWDGGYRLLGWRSDAIFSDAHVLLHPAAAEPYGMVISEAMTARLPVVVSDACGAADDVASDAGRIVALDAPIGSWITAVTAELNRKQPPPGFRHDWHEVARDYLDIYLSLATGES